MSRNSTDKSIQEKIKKSVLSPKTKDTKKILKKDTIQKKIPIENIVLTKTLDLNSIKSPRIKTTNFQIKNFHEATKLVTAPTSNSERLNYKPRPLKKVTNVK